MRFVILEANERIGDTWRQPWDSLRLFTPARFDGLGGHAVPRPAGLVPDEGRDGRLPRVVRDASSSCPCAPASPVDSALARGDRFLVTTKRLDDRGRSRSSSRWRTISGRRRPRLRPPDAIIASCSCIRCDYRNPAQLAPGGVLVVGAGNSGAEIAMEAARGGHAVWLVGARRRRGRRSASTAFVGRHLLARLSSFASSFTDVLTIDTPMGRRARPAFTTMGHRLIRVKRSDLRARASSASRASAA